MTLHGIDLESTSIRAVCRKWKIKELSVFGSVLRDDFRPDSDVDFLLDFDDDAEWALWDLEGMRRELSAIVGRDVDLLTREALLHTRNWLFRKIVLGQSEIVHAS